MSGTLIPLLIPLCFNKFSGADLMSVDVVLKLFNYFSIYTVHTEALKDYCKYANINYKQLRYHTKTR